MEVILLERVEKLGAIGDVVTVKNGFARNYLLPNKKALRANEANRKLFEVNRVEDRGRQCRQARRGREGVEGRRGQDRPADPPGVERRPSLRLGQRPRHRRCARRRRRACDQEPDRARPPDQGDRHARRQGRAAPRGRGDDQGQRRPLARGSRSAGAGHRRDATDVRARRRAGARGANSELPPRRSRPRPKKPVLTRRRRRPPRPEPAAEAAEEAPADRRSSGCGRRRARRKPQLTGNAGARVTGLAPFFPFIAIASVRRIRPCAGGTVGPHSWFCGPESMRG